MKSPFRFLILFALAVVSFISFAAAAERPKNVILMISDGCGMNAWKASSNFQYNSRGKANWRQALPYGEAAGFRFYGCTTYPEGGSYDPALFWKDFSYQKVKATDSAAAATALNTGQKTVNGRISTNRDGSVPLETLAELAARSGRATGIVSTVQLAHATPAAVAAHNSSRKNGPDIFDEIVYKSKLNVAIGAGNPFFDNNGKPRPFKKDSYYPSEKTWTALTSGTTGKDWTFVQNPAVLGAIASGKRPAPERLLAIAPVGDTFQQKRSKGARRLRTVPTLAQASLAALKVLEKKPKGFYLMIEGGAIDWANHSNDIRRMLEEQYEFNLAIESVIRWIKANGGWENNLLIITSDHECGGLWGADKSLLLPNCAPGVIPQHKYASGGHTNALVPLFVRGPGSLLFEKKAVKTDSQAGKVWQFHGRYIDNTDIFEVMRQTLLGK